MFTNDDPVCSAARIAEEAAHSSSNYVATFVEAFLTSFIDMLTNDARTIFWRAMDGIDPSDINGLFYASELLRALRHASKLGLSGSAIIGEFGGLEAISFERLLLWLIEEHGHVLVE